MDMTSIFMAMAKLFLILLVGYFCQKCGVFPQGSQAVLTRVVLYISSPCTILNSVLSSDELPDAPTMGVILAISLSCYVIMLGAGTLITRLLRVKTGSQGVFVTMLLCSNCAFIGFPVLEAIFGVQAVFYGAIYNLPFFPFLYVIGACLIQRDGAALRGEQAKLHVRREDVLHPCMAASILAVVLALTLYQPPAAITQTIASLANITTPCALLIVGISLAGYPLKSMFGNVRIYLMTLLRLIAIPLVLWAVLRGLITDTLMLGVAVVIFGMPVAASIPMLATEYGADELCALQGVFISTILSMLTIPLLMLLLM